MLVLLYDCNLEHCNLEVTVRAVLKSETKMKEVIACCARVCLKSCRPSIKDELAVNLW